MSWDLLESPDFARRDTSSLKAVGGGGAPAPPELVRRIDRGFRNGAPGHRLRHDRDERLRPAERGPRLPAQADELRAHRAGRRDPRHRRERRARSPPGEVGEIWFRGPNLIRGYWNRPEATAETIVDGWLRSGDIGRIDDEGFLYVEDRAKDMVLRAGENVYCAEVEAAIYEHPAVYEAAVFGLPHERLGEEVAAAVVPEAGRAARDRRAPARIVRGAARRVQGADGDRVRGRAAAAQRVRQDPEARDPRRARGARAS